MKRKYISVLAAVSMLAPAGAIHAQPAAGGVVTHLPLL